MCDWHRTYRKSPALLGHERTFLDTRPAQGAARHRASRPQGLYEAPHSPRVSSRPRYSQRPQVRNVHWRALARDRFPAKASSKEASAGSCTTNSRSALFRASTRGQLLGHRTPSSSHSRSVSAPGRSRTRNLTGRNRLLYPVELQGLVPMVLSSSCKNRRTTSTLDSDAGLVTQRNEPRPGRAKCRCVILKCLGGRSSVG